MSLPHGRVGKGSIAALSVLWLSVVMTGCSNQRVPSAESRRARAPRDDFGTVVPDGHAHRPTRIVSLNPGTTELLFAIGAGPRVVGRTTWDVWPDSARAVPDLGPGMRPNVEAVLARAPDLVLLYASDENRAAARQLEGAHIPVLALKVDRIEDFRRAARLLGRATDDSARAEAVVDSVSRTLERVRAATAPLAHPSVFWHVWDSPLYTIGAGSFLDELVTIAGARNVYHDLAAPSPQVSLEDIVRRDPDVILAGPEGRARIATSPAWQSVRAVRAGRVLAVDTNLVGRPSVRLGEAAVSLARMLHPELARGALP